MFDLLQTALGQIGTKEIKGGKHNPEVLKYFHFTGHNWVKTDETAWCSAFINWCCRTAGYEMSNKLNARSWLDVGWRPQQPQMGDVVIFWRISKDDWRGHVGLYVREDEDNIYTLGGNQSNEVCVKPYPKSRLLGFRRLKKL